MPLLDQLISTFSSDQQTILEKVGNNAAFIEGPAGSGKTTLALAHLLRLIEGGASAESILILVPQRSLATPFYEVTQSPNFPAGGKPTILTIGGLAQRMDSLFWPLIAKQGGFHKPARDPRFLTIETAQYFLSTILNPLLEQGYFQNLTIDPNRLGSQIIDNLNKSTTVGFPVDQIAERLSSAWGGKDPRTLTYSQAQECALHFRGLCLERNLLDFSLQLSLFISVLWPSLICRQYLQRSFRHLIYDNIEEDYPVAHDLIREWLPQFDSALLIEDSGAGFRTFLGADPVSAHTLGLACNQKFLLNRSFTKSKEINFLETTLDESIRAHKIHTQPQSGIQNAFSINSFRFSVEAIQWIVKEARRLVDASKARPAEIAILSPYLSDSLRFSFAHQLQKVDLPFQTFHPYRALIDEPVIRSLITLVKLADHATPKKPTRQDVRNAIFQSLTNCDFVRSDLVAQVLYKPNTEYPWLKPFENVNAEMRERISFLVGERYEQLRNWLLQNPLENNGLDYWTSRFFGEILSQPDFEFHQDFISAGIITRFIDSYRKFRDAVQPDSEKSEASINQEFLAVLETGTLAAQSVDANRSLADQDAVILSPAYTYLVNNRTVKYQFWLDIGSQGWWSRLDQPLTQPYVLSRNWVPDDRWTDRHEYSANQQMLNKLTTGLLRRCSEHAYFISVGINEQGIEEKGALLLAIQNILRAQKQSPEMSDV